MFYKKRGLSTRLIANLAVLAVMSAAYPALADPSCRREGPVSSEALGEGRRLFEEGVRAADAGDWERARRYYLEACQQIYDPNIFANVGQANFELKRYRDAAESLSLFIHGASALPGGGNQDAIKRAGQMLERAKARIGTVTIRGAAADAEIFVNGRLMGRARDTFYIEPGLREFVARMPSGEEVRSEEVIKSGTVVDVNLAPPMTVPKAEPVNQLQPSNYMEADGLRTSLVATGLSVMALGLGGGVAFASMSASRGAQAEDVRNLPVDCDVNPEQGSPCHQLKELRREQDLFGNVSVLSFVGGGVAGIATVIYMVAPRSSQTQGALRVFPLVTAQNQALIVSGSW